MVAVIVNVDVAFNVLPLLMVIELSVAAVFTSNVIVKPPSITTSSPAAGAAAPEGPPDRLDHVEVELQFPEATEYTVMASEFRLNNILNKIERNADGLNLHKG